MSDDRQKMKYLMKFYYKFRRSPTTEPMKRQLKAVRNRTVGWPFKFFVKLTFFNLSQLMRQGHAPL